MVNTMRTQLLRDKKETEIDGIYSSIRTTEADRHLYQKTLARTMKNYKEWLVKNNIEGNKYK